MLLRESDCSKRLGEVALVKIDSGMLTTQVLSDQRYGLIFILKKTVLF